MADAVPGRHEDRRQPAAASPQADKTTFGTNNVCGTFLTATVPTMFAIKVTLVLTPLTAMEMAVTIFDNIFVNRAVPVDAGGGLG